MRSSWWDAWLGEQEAQEGLSHFVQLPDSRVELGEVRLCSQETSRNGLRLHWGMSRLDIRKKISAQKFLPFTRA